MRVTKKLKKKTLALASSSQPVKLCAPKPKLKAVPESDDRAYRKREVTEQLDNLMSKAFKTDADEEEATEEARGQVFDGLSHQPRQVRDAAYASFRRKVNSKNPPFPTDFMEAWSNAVKSGSRRDQTALFKIAFQCEDKPARMSIRFSRTRSFETLNTNTEGWYTEDQLALHLNSPALASALVTRKRAQGLYRAHPEMPDVPEATLYWCLKEITTSKQDRTARSLGVEGTVDGIHKNDAEEMMKNIETMNVLDPSVADDESPGQPSKPAAQAKCKPKARPKKKPKDTEGELHSPSDGEADKDPAEICKAWKNLIFKDIGVARKIQLSLRTIPNQKELLQDLTKDITKYENFWAVLNNAADDEGNVRKRDIGSTIRHAYDNLAAFMKNIDTAKGLLRGANRGKAPKETSSRCSTR